MNSGIFSDIKFDDNFKMHSPGYVIDIYKDENTYEYLFGNKMIKPMREKLEKDTLYDIASLTKVFTSVLIYMAFEEKKINIYDTIYNIDNSFIDLKDIKIIDLLSHNQDIWTKGYLGGVTSKEEFYEILYTAYVKDNTPTYEDTHYIILGVILEKIYNKSYENLCKEKIFDVLNLQNTFFNPIPNRCASNNYEHTKNGVVEDIYPGLTHDTKGRVAKQFGLNLAHASIFTTGMDLLMFLKSFLTNKLLKKETIDLMLSHRDVNKDNQMKLKSMTGVNDINKAFNNMKKLNENFSMPKTFNNMGVRYRNDIKQMNDVPDKASNNTVSFSGYTGPMFTIDFDNNLIVVIMCNVIHNSKLGRDERKSITIGMMNKIFENIMKKE